MPNKYRVTESGNDLVYVSISDLKRIRSCDYYNLLAVNLIAHNQLLADLIPVLAAIDFVLGSVDR